MSLAIVRRILKKGNDRQLALNVHRTLLLRITKSMRSSYGSGSFGKRKRYDENRAPSIRDDGKKPPSESAGRHHKMNARPKSTDADSELVSLVRLHSRLPRKIAT